MLHCLSESLFKTLDNKTKEKHRRVKISKLVFIAYKWYIISQTCTNFGVFCVLHHLHENDVCWKSNLISQTGQTVLYVIILLLLLILIWNCNEFLFNVFWRKNSEYNQTFFFFLHKWFYIYIDISCNTESQCLDWQWQEEHNCIN